MKPLAKKFKRFVIKNPVKFIDAHGEEGTKWLHVGTLTAFFDKNNEVDGGIVNLSFLGFDYRIFPEESWESRDRRPRRQEPSNADVLQDKDYPI